jgi:8-oxo-dGTP pyrophosphatase MutT (NUDIX family)
MQTSNIQKNHGSKMTSYNNNFCNNCGNVGHNYQSCKYPITSIGIITFRYHNDELQYLMIQRKDTLGFVEFMRGKYPIHNVEYIQNIFNEMTTHEKTRIKEHTFDELWNELWGKWVASNYRGEERTSREKYKSLKEGILVNNDLYDLNYFIENSTTGWNEAEWGFPKGRRNFQEKDLSCALREFEEETGIIKSDVKVILNIVPYEEIFTGSNLKSYKHKYFVGYINDTVELNNYQKTEVCEVKWCNVSDCIKTMRPYNLEKINIIKKLNIVLHKYRLYS